MTKVAIMPVPDESGGIYFSAIAGDKEVQGRTAGAALDAMTEYLVNEGDAAVIVLQNFRPDSLFTKLQQERLKELMQRWRTARDNGTEFAPSEQQELDQLVELELQASAKRADRLIDELGG